MKRYSKLEEALKVIGACLLVLVCVVCYGMLRVGLYGGHFECMFVHCTKVIQ